MFAIGKALFLLIFDIVFCFFFGTLINNKIWKKQENPIENTLIGFFAQQAVFQVLALGVYWKTAILHHLSILWMGVVLFVIGMTLLFARTQVKNSVKNLFSVVKKNRRIVLFGLLVMGLTAFYVATHGVADDDAMYYIGLVNTTASTDRIYQYNVYTGEIMSAMYGRRALVTFEIQSAVYAQVWNLHALLVTRIFRACENVILTGMAVYLCGTQLYDKAVDREKKSILLMIFYFFLLPMFANTIFTPATFLLRRGYEGKAFTANVIAIFVLYQIVRILRTNQKKEMGLLLLICWGSVAVSTSAIVLCASEVVAIGVFAYVGLWIRKKRERQSI